MSSRQVGAEPAHRRPATVPTIHTIAEAAKVSIATVSYVLNGRDLVDDKIKISLATRDRVLRAAEEVGYRANGMARGMRRGRTEQVCLALNHLDSPWTQAMIATISRAVRALGMTSLLLLDQDWREFLARQQADGAVIFGANLSEDDVAWLTRLGERSVCVVALDCSVEPTTFDVVRQRPRPALDDAVALLTANHARVACLRRGDDGDQDASGRFTAFTAAMERAGREVDPDLVRETHADRYVAHHAALELLQRAERPTAIFATNDLAAISALWAAYRLGIDVPGELEIVGVGNSPEGRRVDPPLTTVGARSPFEDVAGLLVSRLSGERGPSSRVHYSDWSVYRRGTTRRVDGPEDEHDNHDVSIERKQHDPQ